MTNKITLVWADKWRELLDKYYTEEGGYNNNSIVYEFGKFVEQKENQINKAFKEKKVVHHD